MAVMPRLLSLMAEGVKSRALADELDLSRKAAGKLRSEVIAFIARRL